MLLLAVSTIGTPLLYALCACGPIIR